LGDQHPVERITVMLWQAGCGDGVLGDDGEKRISHSRNLVEKLDIDLELAGRNLDFDLPDRRSADGDQIVRFLNRGASFSVKALVVVKSPEQRVAVEEEPQPSSSP
jgi:hypothetical protein